MGVIRLGTPLLLKLPKRLTVQNQGEQEDCSNRCDNRPGVLSQALVSYRN